jgi:hypothetical protein
MLRADWTRAAIVCLAAPGCAPEDECERAAFRAVGIAPMDWPPVVLRCLERGSECGGSSATCRRIAALRDAAQSAASSCFDQSCSAYTSCLGRFVASAMSPAVPAWR